MSFIDSHSHLYLPEFDEDRDAVIERAGMAGVGKILLPNIDSDSVAPMMELCKKYPETCFPMMGLHPTSVKEDFKHQLDKVQEHLSSGSFIAVGEVGMDLYWDKTFLEQQKEAFSFQIDLAGKYSLPLVIHSRDAFAEILDVLRNKSNGAGYKGVFHSFSGDISQAEEVISMGFYIGINGVVTFKNSNLGRVVKEIPLEKIVLETDAPYLTPAPYRGKRNESAYIPYIAQKIADLKEMSLEEVSFVTTRAAMILFNFK